MCAINIYALYKEVYAKMILVIMYVLDQGIFLWTRLDFFIANYLVLLNDRNPKNVEKIRKQPPNMNDSLYHWLKLVLEMAQMPIWLQRKS